MSEESMILKLIIFLTAVLILFQKFNMSLILVIQVSQNLALDLMAWRNRGHIISQWRSMTFEILNIWMTIHCEMRSLSLGSDISLLHTVTHRWTCPIICWNKANFICSVLIIHQHFAVVQEPLCFAFLTAHFTMTAILKSPHFPPSATVVQHKQTSSRLSNYICIQILRYFFTPGLLRIIRLRLYP